MRDDEQKSRINVRVRNLPTELFSLSFSLSLTCVSSVSPYCYQSTERDRTRPDAISSSRGRLLSRTSSRTTYLQKYVSRLSYRSDSPAFFSTVPFSLSFRLSCTRPSREDERRRKLRNEAPKLPKWPCERCVGRIAFSFVRVW